MQGSALGACTTVAAGPQRELLWHVDGWSLTIVEGGRGTLAKFQ